VKKLFKRLKMVKADIICRYTGPGTAEYTLIIEYVHRKSGETFTASQIVEGFTEGLAAAEVYRKILR